MQSRCGLSGSTKLPKKTPNIGELNGGGRVIIRNNKIIKKNGKKKTKANKRAKREGFQGNEQVKQGAVASVCS